jgi:hypothetical protein
MHRLLRGLAASPTALRPAKVVVLEARRQARRAMLRPAEERYRRLPRDMS